MLGIVFMWSRRGRCVMCYVCLIVWGAYHAQVAVIVFFLCGRQAVPLLSRICAIQFAMPLENTTRTHFFMCSSKCFAKRHVVAHSVGYCQGAVGHDRGGQSIARCTFVCVVGLFRGWYGTTGEKQSDHTTCHCCCGAKPNVFYHVGLLLCWLFCICCRLFTCGCVVHLCLLIVQFRAVHDCFF